MTDEEYVSCSIGMRCILEQPCLLVDRLAQPWRVQEGIVVFLLLNPSKQEGIET